MKNHHSTPATRPTQSLVVYGTGHPIAGNTGKFLGTVQMMSGDLVWHVFEQSLAALPS